MAEQVNFSGVWTVDKSRSGTLEEILKVMGVPWLAIRLVLSLDVTTEITHDPATGQLLTLDRTSLGVLSTNELRTDGVEVARKGKDGRLALLTSTITAELPAGFVGRPLPLLAGAAAPAASAPALSYLRITTVLPDGEGVSDNVWEMRGGGREMQAFTTFTKGDKVARASRVMLNKAWVEGRVSDALPSQAVLEPSGVVEEAVEQQGGAGAAEEEDSTPLLPHPLSLAPSHVDPLFISLAGHWQELPAPLPGSAPCVGMAGLPFAATVAPLLAALTQRTASASAPSSSSSSTSSTSSSSSILSIQHAAAPGARVRHLRLSSASLWGPRLSTIDTPLDGKWRWHALDHSSSSSAQPVERGLLVRGLQVQGQGDLGPTWLGHELGFQPPDLLSIPGAALDARHGPYFSSCDFEPALYSLGEVRLEVHLPEQLGSGAVWEGGQQQQQQQQQVPAGVRHSVVLVGDGLGGKLWVGVSAAGLAVAASDGGQLLQQQLGRLRAHPEGLRWCALGRRPGEVHTEAMERRRLGGARAVLLHRRALADGERKRLLMLLPKEESEGEGEGGEAKAAE